MFLPIHKVIMQNLLSQIAIINKKNAELIRATGLGYNIFNILGLSSNETRLHSAFLANLLNPQGSHGLKCKPLDTFLKIVGATHLDSSTATVTIEKFAGSVTDNEGGRIDIYIADKHRNSIIIENKIYADDQSNQLLRYFNFARSNCKEFQLFYLTLEGSSASEISTGSQKIDYLQLSYRVDIQAWLDECLMLASTHPLLRETIVQYSNLINQLTNNDMNTQAKEEILEVLTNSKSNIEAALKIASYDYDIKVSIVKRYLNPFFEQYAKDNDLEFNSDFVLNKKYTGFNLYKKTWKYGRIRVAFEAQNCNAMLYGINDTDLNNFPASTRELLKQVGEGSSDHYPYHKYCNKYKSWNNETFIAIIEGNFQKTIEQELDFMLSLANTCEL